MHFKLLIILNMVWYRTIICWLQVLTADSFISQNLNIVYF